MIPTMLATVPAARPVPSTTAIAAAISAKNHQGMRCFVTMRARPPSMYCAVYSSPPGFGASSSMRFSEPTAMVRVCHQPRCSSAADA